MEFNLRSMSMLFIHVCSVCIICLVVYSYVVSTDYNKNLLPKNSPLSRDTSLHQDNKEVNSFETASSTSSEVTPKESIVRTMNESPTNVLPVNQSNEELADVEAETKGTGSHHPVSSPPAVSSPVPSTTSRKKRRLPLYHTHRHWTKDNTRNITTAGSPPPAPPPCDRHTLYQPDLTTDPNTFQDVGNQTAYVYSAHLDPRFPPGVYVRVIGVFQKVPEVRLQFWCHLWHRGEPHPVTVLANMWREQDKKYGLYSAALFTCLTESPVDLMLVSLSLNPCSVTQNALRVTPPDDLLPRVNLTACVSPITRNYDARFQFVEMVEINRMFGIERFVFYNTSISPAMERYLWYFMDKNIGFIRPWSLQGIKDTSSGGIIYFGQVAAQLDCFYRHMGSSTYIAYIDLDELLVIRSDRTPQLMDLINEARSATNKTLCNFQFRHVNFDMSAANSSVDITSTSTQTAAIKTWHINSLRQFHRTIFWRHRERSKYIVDVRHLVVPGVHRADVCRNGTVNLHIPTTEGAVYHYREKPLWRPFMEMDTALLRFKDDVIERIVDAHEAINKSTSG